MICDGILPSNEGGGYVLVAFAAPGRPPREAAGVNDPFPYSVVDTVIHENEGSTPTPRRSAGICVNAKVIRTRRRILAGTIDGGMRSFSDLPGRAHSS